MEDGGVSMRQKLFAMVALSSTGTFVGLFSKFSQTRGKYQFSPASAVVCTEFFKLIISIVMLARLLLRGELVDRSVGSAVVAQKVAGANAAKDGGAKGSGDDELCEILPADAAEKNANDNDDDNDKDYSGNYGTSPTTANGVGGYRRDLADFWRANYSPSLLCHEFGLAAAYTIVNIVTYAIFVHASGSMFFLLKASSPVVTAVLLWLMVNRNISRPQWIAVSLQCLGLLGTQLNPCGADGASSVAVSPTGYILILINVIVSCAAGVWNEHIIKNYGTSVNFQNFFLYSFGVVINLLLFWFAPPRLIGAASDEQLGFFEGYNASVFGIIMANGSVGLVITMVYKYADVVVKTFGLAGSTITLFVLEGMGVIPGGRAMPLSTTLTGGAAVFYASYVYILPAKEFAPLSLASKDGGGGGANNGSNSNSGSGGSPPSTSGAGIGKDGTGGGKAAVRVVVGGGAADEKEPSSGAALLSASTASLPSLGPSFDVMAMSWRAALAHRKIRTLLAIGLSVFVAFLAARTTCSLGM